ncbi:MAG: nucleotide exchange factor GrpE [Deltaproteobacteria bacterium]|nr:nucleotide exchange factor GrpE [Deltaproteobacteria bacterium]
MNPNDKVEQLRQSIKAKKEAEAAAQEAASQDKASPGQQMTELKNKLGALEKELKDSQEKAKKFQEDYLRAHAEMQNYQRRLQKEKQGFIKYGNENLLKEILPILDSLEKALETSPSEGESLHQGVSLVHKQFLNALEKFGLQLIKAQGEVFDPNYHEAISQVETDAQASGTVWEVFRTGYLYHDRVLRAAMVSVVA